MLFQFSLYFSVAILLAELIFFVINGYWYRSVNSYMVQYYISVGLWMIFNILISCMIIRAKEKSEFISLITFDIISFIYIFVFYQLHSINQASYIEITLFLFTVWMYLMSKFKFLLSLMLFIELYQMLITWVILQ